MVFDRLMGLIQAVGTRGRPGLDGPIRVAQGRNGIGCEPAADLWSIIVIDRLSGWIQAAGWMPGGAHEIGQWDQKLPDWKAQLVAWVKKTVK